MSQTAQPSEDNEVYAVPEFDMSDLLHMRNGKHPEVYETFFDKFVPCILPRKSDWSKKILSAKCDEDLTTCSNEAFALLVLENNWDRWLDMYNKLNGEVAK